MEQAPVTRTCKKCGEIKLLELFTGSSICRFGKTHTCKECTSKKSKNFYYIKYYKPKPKKPIEPTELPISRTCIKCGETKLLELFEKDNSKKIGTRGTCKKCRKEAKKHYNKAPRKKKQVDRPLKHQEPPIIKTCTNCKETKEIELFKTNNKRKFGRDSICKKCDALRSKQYHAKRGPIKPYLNYKEPPSTITCVRCKQTKESQFFVKDRYKKFGIKSRCLECEKIKQKQKYKRRNHSGLLTNFYLKKLISVSLNIHSSQVTDEQLQLQKESILLHREYKQLKQQLQ